MAHLRWWAALLFLTTLACAVSIPTSQPLTIIETVEQTQSWSLAGASRAQVRLRMLSGDFVLQPWDASLQVATAFRYNVEEWAPQITQTMQNTNARLTVNQGIGTQLAFGGEEFVNAWNVALPHDVPIDLGVDLGAGMATLDLGGISLSDLGVTAANADMTLTFTETNPEPLGLLRVTAGTGNLNLRDLGNANFDRLSLIGGAGTVQADFGGAWTRSAVADVRAGAGQVTLRVPATLGVRINYTTTPMSALTLNGFVEQSDNVYVNAAYGESSITLTINLTAGIGAVTLTSE